MPPTILTAVILAVVGSGGFGTLVAWLLRRVDGGGVAVQAANTGNSGTMSIDVSVPAGIW
jgi:hypothetical protein